MGNTIPKISTESINWKNLKTENFSDNVYTTKYLSSDANMLLSRISDSNHNQISYVKSLPDSDSESESSFISSEMYKYLVKENKPQSGGGKKKQSYRGGNSDIDEDSSTSSTSSSESDSEDDVKHKKPKEHKNHKDHKDHKEHKNHKNHKKSSESDNNDSEQDSDEDSDEDSDNKYGGMSNNSVGGFAYISSSAHENDSDSNNSDSRKSDSRKSQSNKSDSRKSDSHKSQSNKSDSHKLNSNKSYSSESYKSKHSEYDSSSISNRNNNIPPSINTSDINMISE